MPIELILSPIMRPVVHAKSILFAPHRNASHYVPTIKEFPTDNSKISSYAVIKRIGSGNKILDVFDTNNGINPIGSPDPNSSIFWFKRSRAAKGGYKMYSSQQPSDEPMAAIRAGLRGNVLLIRAPEVPAAELGWHIINHRVDAIDSYRMFTLANGYTYQWTYRGKWLEIVHNLGEKESEIRERIGKVETNGDFGFTLFVDESKIVRELALSTALCSYIDQWNTNLEVGGIYYGRQPGQVRWKRD